MAGVGRQPGAATGCHPLAQCAHHLGGRRHRQGAVERQQVEHRGLTAGDLHHGAVRRDQAVAAIDDGHRGRQSGHELPGVALDLQQPIGAGVHVGVDHERQVEADRAHEGLQPRRRGGVRGVEPTREPRDLAGQSGDVPRRLETDALVNDPDAHPRGGERVVEAAGDELAPVRRHLLLEAHGHIRRHERRGVGPIAEELIELVEHGGRAGGDDRGPVAQMPDDGVVDAEVAPPYVGAAFIEPQPERRGRGGGGS